jgi:hypothetical protein
MDLVVLILMLSEGLSGLAAKDPVILLLHLHLRLILMLVLRLTENGLLRNRLHLGCLGILVDVVFVSLRLGGLYQVLRRITCFYWGLKLNKARPNWRGVLLDSLDIFACCGRPPMARLILELLDTLNNLDPMESHFDPKILLEVDISHVVHDLPIHSDILYIT